MKNLTLEIYREIENDAFLAGEWVGITTTGSYGPIPKIKTLVAKAKSSLDEYYIDNSTPETCKELMKILALINNTSEEDAKKMIADFKE